MIVGRAQRRSRELTDEEHAANRIKLLKNMQIIELKQKCDGFKDDGTGVSRIMTQEELRRFESMLDTRLLASLGVEAHKQEILTMWRQVQLDMEEKNKEHGGEEQAGSTSAGSGTVTGHIAAPTTPRPFDELVPEGQDIHGELLLSAADIMTTDRADELIVKGALVEIRGLQLNGQRGKLVKKRDEGGAGEVTWSVAGIDVSEYSQGQGQLGSGPGKFFLGNIFVVLRYCSMACSDWMNSVYTPNADGRSRSRSLKPRFDEYSLSSKCSSASSSCAFCDRQPVCRCCRKAWRRQQQSGGEGSGRSSAAAAEADACWMCGLPSLNAIKESVDQLPDDDTVDGLLAAQGSEQVYGGENSYLRVMDFGAKLQLDEQDQEVSGSGSSTADFNSGREYVIYQNGHPRVGNTKADIESVVTRLEDELSDKKDRWHARATALVREVEYRVARAQAVNELFNSEKYPFLNEATARIVDPNPVSDAEAQKSDTSTPETAVPGSTSSEGQDLPTDQAHSMLVDGHGGQSRKSKKNNVKRALPEPDDEPAVKKQRSVGSSTSEAGSSGDTSSAAVVPNEAVNAATGKPEPLWKSHDPLFKLATFITAELLPLPHYFSNSKPEGETPPGSDYEATQSDLSLVLTPEHTEILDLMRKFIGATDIALGTIQRLRVGNFLDKGRADALVSEVSNKGLTDIINNLEEIYGEVDEDYAVEGTAYRLLVGETLVKTLNKMFKEYLDELDMRIETAVAYSFQLRFAHQSVRTVEKYKQVMAWSKNTIASYDEYVRTGGNPLAVPERAETMKWLREHTTESIDPVWSGMEKEIKYLQKKSEGIIAKAVPYTLGGTDRRDAAVKYAVEAVFPLSGDSRAMLQQLEFAEKSIDDVVYRAHNNIVAECNRVPARLVGAYQRVFEISRFTSEERAKHERLIADGADSKSMDALLLKMFGRFDPHSKRLLYEEFPRLLPLPTDEADIDEGIINGPYRTFNKIDELIGNAKSDHTNCLGLDTMRWTPRTVQGDSDLVRKFSLFTRLSQLRSSENISPRALFEGLLPGAVVGAVRGAMPREGIEMLRFFSSLETSGALGVFVNALRTNLTGVVVEGDGGPAPVVASSDGAPAGAAAAAGAGAATDADASAFYAAAAGTGPGTPGFVRASSLLPATAPQGQRGIAIPIGRGSGSGLPLPGALATAIVNALNLMRAHLSADPEFETPDVAPTPSSSAAAAGARASSALRGAGARTVTIGFAFTPMRVEGSRASPSVVETPEGGSDEEDEADDGSE